MGKMTPLTARLLPSPPLRLWSAPPVPPIVRGEVCITRVERRESRIVGAVSQCITHVVH